jgi:hypothetical protein
MINSTNKYYIINRDKILKKIAIWQKNNPEKVTKYKIKYDLGHREEKNKYSRRNFIKLKVGVVEKFSNNNCCCKCGENNIFFLTVDHIKNNGSKNGRYGKLRSGVKLYRYLIKTNCFGEYQILCWNCNWLKHLENIGYNKNNTEKHKYIKANKLIVLKHYSINSDVPKCNCCGETNIDVLTIDHINNDGFKKRPHGGGMLYAQIIKNNFPKEYATLCFNCNSGRKHGECPHVKGKNIRE